MPDPDQEAILSARRAARWQAACRQDELRQLHRRVAELLASPEVGPRILQRARVRLAKWERDRLCSRDFIERWAHVLDGGPAALEHEVLDPASPWAQALMQNTPFSFLLRAEK